MHVIAKRPSRQEAKSRNNGTAGGRLFLPPQQNSWVPGGVLEGVDRRSSGISGQKEWFAIGWPKSDPDGAIRRGQWDILPALAWLSHAWLSLAWLSLAGLLASIARLRFTRQIHQAKCTVSDEFLPFHSRPVPPWKRHSFCPAMP